MAKTWRPTFLLGHPAVVWSLVGDIQVTHTIAKPTGIFLC